MKTISKKQFKNAVKRVLNGGSSKMIKTHEEEPFSWNVSKRHCNLRGKQPENSKFLRNDAPRNGKEGDVFLVCTLVKGYEIVETKKEKAKRLTAENKKKAERRAKAKQRHNAEKEEAKKYGLSASKFRKLESSYFSLKENARCEFIEKQKELFKKSGLKNSDKHEGHIAFKVSFSRFCDYDGFNFPTFSEFIKNR